LFCVVFCGVYAWATVVVVCRSTVATTEHTTIMCTMLLCSLMVVVVDDALYFYSLFEVLLVLMYGCITSYSYTTRSSYSVQMLVGYTILGSTLLALALVLLYTCTGTCTSTQTVASTYHSTVTTCSTVMVHVAFYCKIPCYPLHQWLTEAHVEGTTEASTILAGVYLKVGIIG